MKTIPEKSADTAILESMIRGLSVDQMLTYEAMSTALGRDVRKHCRGNLNSARRSCERGGVILGVVPNEGYKRLSDTGIIGASHGDTKRVVRLANRGIRKLGAVKFEELEGEQKRQHTAVAAQLGALSHFASGKALKAIESKVNGSAKLALGETLKLFTE